MKERGESVWGRAHRSHAIFLSSLGRHLVWEKVDEKGGHTSLIFSALSLSPSFSHCSKCIQLHFPPALYLPPGNTVISVGVIKTAIKSLSVWFPMTVYRLWEGRLSCCVERGGVCVCISSSNDVLDRRKLKVFCGIECDLHQGLSFFLYATQTRLCSNSLTSL